MKKFEISENRKAVIVIATGIVLCACICFGYNAYKKHQRQAAVEKSIEFVNEQQRIINDGAKSYLESAELTGDATWYTTPPETNKEKENNGQN